MVKKQQTIDPMEAMFDSVWDGFESASEAELDLALQTLVPPQTKVGILPNSPSSVSEPSSERHGTQPERHGWMSLFGGRRATYGGGTSSMAAGALSLQPQQEEDEQEDLEIPSFLRRLAN